jgi:hypothetical protein
MLQHNGPSSESESTDRNLMNANDLDPRFLRSLLALAAVQPMKCCLVIDNSHNIYLCESSLTVFQYELIAISKSLRLVPSDDIGAAKLRDGKQSRDTGTGR